MKRMHPTYTLHGGYRTAEDSLMGLCCEKAGERHKVKEPSVQRCKSGFNISLKTIKMIESSIIFSSLGEEVQQTVKF